MKILSLFNHYLEEGGEAKAVAAINEALAKDFTLDVCEFWSADWKRDDAPHFLKQAAWMLRNPQSIRQVRGLQAAFKADCWIVHNVFPVGSAAIYREAPRLGVPLIQYVHNFRPFSINGYLWAGGGLAQGGLSGNYWSEICHASWQDSRLKTAWMAFVLSLCRKAKLWDSVNAWITVSEFVRQKFIGAGLEAHKVHTLRHFWKPRAESSIEVERRHYLFLGRLIEAKGVLKLLEAWRLLERELGSATPPLVIAGDGPLRETLEQRAEQIRSISIVGSVSGNAKRDLVEKARAVLVPSLWWEPLGLVVYEAYDHSVPVLAASSGGLKEIIQDHRTGFLHEAGNVEQIVRDVLKLETDPGLSIEFGRQGRRWLEENASESEWRHKFRSIVEQALQGETPRR